MPGKGEGAGPEEELDEGAASHVGAGLRKRRGLRGRLDALRDYGPGSGSIDALLRRRDEGGRQRLEGGAAIAERWRSIPEIGRQRLIAAAIVTAIAALIWFLLLPISGLAPCEWPGGDSCVPDDDAIELVPADALAYAHLSLDADDEQHQSVAALATRAPGLVSGVLGAISSGPFADVDLERVRGWASEEAALAVLPIGRQARSAALISIADEAAARAHAAGLLGSRASTESVDGVAVSVARNGGRRALAAAFFAGFAVFGERDAVAAIVSRWTAQGPSLTEDPDARAAIARLPDRRAAYAYLSPAGAQGLLRGAGRALEAFVNPAATAGVAAALASDEERLSLAVRSILDPALSAESPGAFAALSPFEPSLATDVGPRALAYLGVGDPAASVDRLATQAEAGAGPPRELRRAARAARKAIGVDVAGGLLPLLGSQAALSVQPVGGAEEATGVVGSAGAPYASLLATGVEPGRAARTLAELQEPFAKAVAAGGPPQRFETVQIAGVPAQSLEISPAIDLTYAIWDDRLVIATDPLGIEQARSEGEGLSDAPDFESATSGLPPRPALLAYVNVDEILALAEQIGFATDPTYAALAPELRNFRAAALGVAAKGTEIATDLDLVIAGER